MTVNRPKSYLIRFNEKIVSVVSNIFIWRFWWYKNVDIGRTIISFVLFYYPRYVSAFNSCETSLGVNRVVLTFPARISERFSIVGAKAHLLWIVVTDDARTRHSHHLILIPDMFNVIVFRKYGPLCKSLLFGVMWQGL